LFSIIDEFLCTFRLETGKQQAYLEDTVIVFPPFTIPDQHTFGCVPP